MGIDRIGHGGPTAQVPDGGGAAQTTPTQAAFQVSKAAATAPIAAPDIDAVHASSSALGRLRAGEVDLGGYVDLKVNEATAHLSALPPVQLDAIRSALRERLAGDPSLVDLLRAATGETLQPSND